MLRARASAARPGRRGGLAHWARPCGVGGALHTVHPRLRAAGPALPVGRRRGWARRRAQDPGARLLRAVAGARRADLGRRPMAGGWRVRTRVDAPSARGRRASCRIAASTPATRGPRRCGTTCRLSSARRSGLSTGAMSPAAPHEPAGDARPARLPPELPRRAPPAVYPRLPALLDPRAAGGRVGRVTQGQHYPRYKSRSTVTA